jgi:phage terminase small subunit
MTVKRWGLMRRVTQLGTQHFCEGVAAGILALSGGFGRVDAVDGMVTDGGSGQLVPPRLNARQQRFVAEYLVDLNGASAYERAGYKATGASARVNASKLLTNPNIRAAIATGQKERAERLQLKADAVVRELARLAFSDIGAIAEWGVEGSSSVWGVDDLPRPFLRLRPNDALLPEERASIRKIKETRYGLEVELHDKVAALVALARHFGLLNGQGDDVADENGVPKIPIETLRLLQRRNEVLKAKLRAMGVSEDGSFAPCDESGTVTAGTVRGNGIAPA